MTEVAKPIPIAVPSSIIPSKIISSNDNTIDVQKLSNGIYLIRVSSDAKIGAQRFIKN